MKSVSRIVRTKASESMDYIWDKTKSSVSNLVDNKIHYVLIRKILPVQQHVYKQYRNKDEIS